MIVVDASVAAKWFLPEAGTAEAVALQEGEDQLLAPDLIRVEVAAAITRRVRDPKKPLAPKDAEQRVNKWLRLLDDAALELIRQEQLMAEAAKLSIDRQHPLQDCLYLAAARQYDLPLITADRVFHKRVSPFYRKLTLLSGCQAN